MLDQFVNPEDRFSRDATCIMVNLPFTGPLRATRTLTPTVMESRYFHHFLFQQIMFYDDSLWLFS